MALWIVAAGIVFLSLVETVGDSFIKNSGSYPDRYVSTPWLVAGIIMYIMAAVGWFFVMKHVKLGSLGMIYALSSVTFLFIFGMVFFHESYSKTEMIGLGLGFIALCLLAKSL